MIHKTLIHCLYLVSPCFRLPAIHWPYGLLGHTLIPTSVSYCHHLSLCKFHHDSFPQFSQQPLPPQPWLTWLHSPPLPVVSLSLSPSTWPLLAVSLRYCHFLQSTHCWPNLLWRCCCSSPSYSIPPLHSVPPSACQWRGSLWFRFPVALSLHFISRWPHLMIPSLSISLICWWHQLHHSSPELAPIFSHKTLSACLTHPLGHGDRPIIAWNSTWPGLTFLTFHSKPTPFTLRPYPIYIARILTFLFVTLANTLTISHFSWCNISTF